MSDIYVAIHVATTCDDSSSYISKDATETIELSWSFIDASTLDISGSQTILVKPVHTPVTPFCTQSTGLTYDDVKSAGSFKDAISQLDKSVQQHVFLHNKDFVFVSMDISKIRVQLPREARDKGVVLPPYLQHPRIFDLQNEYCKWQATHPEALSYSSNLVANILTALEVDFSDLELPSPVLESSTPIPEKEPKKISMNSIYCKLLVQLIKKSIPIEDHSTVLTKPYDSSQDVRLFLSERSKILYICNLPFDATQSELESWFTQFGARPIAFWTLKNLESNSQPQVNQKKYKGICGFAVFASHEEATESLSLNGRALNNRPIEIQPSSTRVLDKASELLTPFPPLKNRPRPGDWTCPSCGFSNFQRRTACFRCSFPASSAVAFQEQSLPGNVMNRRPNNVPVNPNILLNQNNTTAPNEKLGMYYNENYHNNHPRNGNNNNGGNVPFRAGDWKCTNEACQYHNFAKNLVCLKCGINKPLNLHNNKPNHQHHSVSSTAAAIAAATASGQPLSYQKQYKPLQYQQGTAVNGTNLSRTNSNGTQISNQLMSPQVSSNQHLLTQHYLNTSSLNLAPLNLAPMGHTSVPSNNISASPQGIYQSFYPHYQLTASQTIPMKSYDGLESDIKLNENLQLDNLGFSISNQFSSLNLNNNV